MISNCNGKRITGNAKQLAEKYEKLAQEAEIEKNMTSFHTYRQHAEHWRRQG